MIAIERHFTAARFNQILNDDLVRPDVADMAQGLIDVSSTVHNKNNVLLVGDHGASIFLRLTPGLYEVHTAVLREGRGSWVYGFAREVTNWLFTRTEAFEIVTRIPAKHLAARHLAMKTGMRHEYTRPNETVWRGQKQDIDIYSFRVQDWAGKATGFAQHGHAFHERLREEANRLKITESGHDEDEQHNHYVGIAMAMIDGGQTQKAVNWYNRWALMSRHAPITLVKLDPVTIKFDIGYLVFENGWFRVERMDMAA